MQESGIAAAGVDISDPSALKKYEWGIVCGQLMMLPTEEGVPKDRILPSYCDLPKMQNLLTASKGKCVALDNSGSDVEAVCQTFTALVRAFVCGTIVVSEYQP